VTAVIVLAAGEGQRMRSHRPKVLHSVGGMPMLEHVLRATAGLPVDARVVVVGPDADGVEGLVGDRAEVVVQQVRRGTGHAVRMALAVLSPSVDRVLVLYGDTPLVPPDLLARLLEEPVPGTLAASVVTAQVDDPTGYGRIVRGPDGSVLAIVEERDATVERAIHEVNTGVGLWERAALADLIPALADHAGEQYLTDAVAGLAKAGRRVGAVTAPDPRRFWGVNTRAQLARVEAVQRELTLDRLMEAGVTIIDPSSTYVDVGVEVGMDSILHPGTWLRGRTVLGEQVEVGPHAEVCDSQVMDHAVIRQAVVEQSHVGAHAHVGPFSHLRAGTYLERDVHIGNYVELKNARMGLGSKAGHHCYLGDVTVGSHVNIGAGTVVVNYDGEQKHHSFIGDEAFIGCNANLVAPVEIGPGAYVAAGSTITHNVPAEALAIARSRQENKSDWVRHRGLASKVRR
jgi:bifunctional UDP-N-acetylglucosamine pyrophosphorylase/glucosamine-1-phosphate N-acetyltransferase